MYICTAEYKYNTTSVYKLKETNTSKDIFDGEKLVNRDEMIKLVASGMVTNVITYIRGKDICLRLDKRIPKYKTRINSIGVSVEDRFYYRIKEAAMSKTRTSFLNLVTTPEGFMKQIGLEKYLDSKYMATVDINNIIKDVANSLKACYIAGIHSVEGITNEVRIITSTRQSADKFIKDYINRLSVKYYSGENKPDIGITEFVGTIKKNSYVQAVR